MNKISPNYLNFEILVSKIAYQVTVQQQEMQETSNRAGSLSRAAIRDASSQACSTTRSLSAERITTRHNLDPEILDNIQKARDKLINIVPASRGIHGPTYLVDYSEYGKPIACVLKWTNWDELRAQRVYQEIVSMIRFDHFSVPASAMYDELSGEYEDLNGHRAQLANSAHILSSLNKILDFGKKRIRHGNQVMLTTKVLGSTLSDFLSNKYNFLSTEEKANFMIQLGQLAMLDIFLGNHDRLFHDEKQNGSILQFGANLGNVMVNEDDFLKFHLIDNQIDDWDNDCFRKFAKDLAQDRELVLNIMAENLEKSILNSCNMEEVPCVKGEIQSIREQMSQIEPWLRIGLSQMEEILRKVICKAWIAKNRYSSHEEKIVVSRAKIFLNPNATSRAFVPKCLQNTL